MSIKFAACLRIKALARGFRRENDVLEASGRSTPARPSDGGPVGTVAADQGTAELTSCRVRTSPSPQGHFPFRDSGVCRPGCGLFSVSCKAMSNIRKATKINSLSPFVLDISTARFTIRYHLRSDSGSNGSGVKESSPLLGIGPILIFLLTLESDRANRCM